MTDKSLTDAPERLLDCVVGLRTFEGSDALGNGDFSLLHAAADEIERLREVANEALVALELHAKQYPHMQKGYTVDAITLLRIILTPNG